MTISLDRYMSMTMEEIISLHGQLNGRIDESTKSSIPLKIDTGNLSFDEIVEKYGFMTSDELRNDVLQKLTCGNYGSVQY